MDRLLAVEKAKRKVLVTGQLFYDNIHRVNAHAAKASGGQPKRFSLGDVHPITELQVCSTAPCSESVKSQWIKLEEVTIPPDPL
ncbi:MAG: hypothetical protein JWN02_807 [Acidobacteria bacterium]|nr:hypothetical protein [Acidobacteriota bacterium]